MKTCTLIRIWYLEEEQASPLSGLCGYGYYFQGLAEQFGGRCLAHLKDGMLTIALQGVPKAEVDRRLEDILRLAMQRGELVQLSKQDGAPTPIELPEQFLQPGAIVRKVLTKKLLFSLPEGAYVASNTFISPAEKAERDDSPEEV